MRACGACLRHDGLAASDRGQYHLKDADYVLAHKGNQGTLRDDVELYFTDQKDSPFKDVAVSRHQTLEKGHGRIQTRAVIAPDQIDWLKKRHNWTG